jgi:hypothetical protein
VAKRFKGLPILKTMKPPLKLSSAAVILAALLADHCFAATNFIGINFTGANANGAPTSLTPGESAGVIPQTGWNNFSAYSVSKGILGDGASNITGIIVSYQTGEMWGSGTYNVGSGFTSGNDKLLNGYLNSQDPTNSTMGTNIITFTNLSSASTYSIIAYTVRDQSGAQAAYWVNDDYAHAFVILSEGRFDWQLDPTFRQGTNMLRPSSEYANYVRWDGVAPRPNGTLSVSVASEYDSTVQFYRGPINGIQLLSTNAWPTNSTRAEITLQPVNKRVPQGQSGTFQVVANGPWRLQWYSNNLPVAGATLSSFTSAPLVDFAGGTNQYYVIVSNNVNSVTSSVVHLVLVPPLPPGGIFYDPFDYIPGALVNQGDYTPDNIALVNSSGLSYTDSNGLSLEVSGKSMRPQIDWDPFPNMPIKLFGTNVYGGPNSTNYVSYLYDFTNLSTNNSGYIGVSCFLNTNVPPNWDWPDEQLFMGKRWYNDFLGIEGGGGFGDSSIPYRTKGMVVVRIADDGFVTTVDMFVNPPLSGLPATPDLTVNPISSRSFNAVAVNAGEWDGPVGQHRDDFTAPGPLVDEFRFGTTYASVAPVQPRLTIQRVGANVQLSWPTVATGYSLQQSDSLSAPNWVAGPAGNPVTITAPPGTRYYRLRK